MFWGRWLGWLLGWSDFLPVFFVGFVVGWMDQGMPFHFVICVSVFFSSGCVFFERIFSLKKTRDLTPKNTR